MSGNAGLVLALAGGVGGAKLVEGLAAVLEPEHLVVVVNTGDDFDHLGLHISPDLDTVMYTLAGLSNPDQGWGLANETFHGLDALGRLGGETWFRLGDRDLATHLERTRRLKTEALSAVTADFCRKLGVRPAVVPMSDEPVRTILETDSGALDFQDYFVRRKCAPRVAAVHYRGAEAAKPTAAFSKALSSADLSAVIICPSNPFLSIAPILAVPSVRASLANHRAPIVAVSPIIGGQAVKGPAAKMMVELGLEVSPRGVAAFYGDLLDGMVIDRADESQRGEIRGPEVDVTQTLMQTRDDKIALARHVLSFCARLKT